MTSKNSKALLEALKAYQQNPTSEHELNVALLVSIATSLAVIADRMSDTNDMAESEE